jgi:hypothetical protein
MDAQEKRSVLEELVSSEARLLELVDGLTAAQWEFHETPERWSIAEIIEHVVVFEGFIRGMIAKVLEEPAEFDKKALAPGKEYLVLGLAETRSVTFRAREAVRPVGRWTGGGELIAALRKERAETVAFVSETDATLRDHFFPHIAFGDLDCYQWLVVLGQHGFRHALQIEEIKADPSYPA